MNHPLDRLSKPVIIAHRGASAYAPENTVAAFQVALENHADALEFDVRLTADNEIIVFHDAVLEHNTNGNGRVHAATWDKLRDVLVRSPHPETHPPQPIPHLNQVLDLVGHTVPLNIEIKSHFPPWDSFPQRVARTIQAHDLTSEVLISSFNPCALYQVRSIDPDIATGLLIKYPWQTNLSRKVIKGVIPHQSVHLPTEIATGEMVRDYHDTQKYVLIYTVNDPAALIKAVNLDVDGIFTDDPGMAYRVLTKMGLRQNPHGRSKGSQ